MTLATRANLTCTSAARSGARSITSFHCRKVALFRRLFRGRTDVYPIRWDS